MGFVLFRKIIKKNKKPTTILSSDQENLLKQLEVNVKNVLERAERIKAKLKENEYQKAPRQEINFPSLPVNTDLDQLGDLDVNDDDSSQQAAPSFAQSSTSTGKAFTKAEISVLRNGSSINSRDYVPFFSEIDTVKEKFHGFPIPFTDKDGKLALSGSQRERFSQWIRPHELYENPTLIMTVSSFSVKQTCISDCSFVSSLTVIAQYERKFNKNLLSK